MEVIETAQAERVPGAGGKNEINIKPRHHEKAWTGSQGLKHRILIETAFLMETFVQTGQISMYGS